MKLREIFHKHGGIKLFKSYFQNGCFIAAIGQFLLLGKSRTALEILRLSVQLKVKNKLERKYQKKLLNFNDHYDDSKETHENSNKVWVCWFQGIEEAPYIVRKCYKSLNENLTNREIILITSENMFDYVSFPDYIIKKWKSGIITHTHMTDLLRLELLIKYGGTWIDATVFCSEKEEKIPSYFFDSDLFFFQTLKPGRDGHCIYNSSWFMSSKTNNKLLLATQYLCYEYWKKYNRMIDYFLLHYFFSIVLDYYREDWSKVIPKDNSTPHILLLRLFDTYNEKNWASIKEQTPFHKLTYKFEKENENKKDTYYKHIFNLQE